MSSTTIDADTIERLQNRSKGSASKELFDAKPYERPVPRLYGAKADRLEIKFAGTIQLDPTDEHDLALISSLLLGQDITLSVEAAVAAKNFKVTRGEDETTATHTVTARVHTLYRDREEA